MNKFNIIFIFTFFTFFSNAQLSDKNYLDEIKFKKNLIFKKNDTIIYISSQYNNYKERPTIIFLQGSLPIPVINLQDNIPFPNLPFKIDSYIRKYNFILISRKGVPLVLDYDKEKQNYNDTLNKKYKYYEKFNSLYYRVFQVKSVLKDLIKKRWVRKDSIFIVGHSEGYRVAAKVAENNNNIRKLVCLSANPFNRIVDEIVSERISNKYNDSIHQLNVHNLIDDYLTIPKKISKYKNDYKLYNWFSYNKEMTFKSFKKFKNPLLIVYGTNDKTSLQNDLLPFLLNKKNLQLKVYPDLDHNFFKKEFDKNGTLIKEVYNWDIVFKDIVEWLTNVKFKQL